MIETKVLGGGIRHRPRSLRNGRCLLSEHVAAYCKTMYSGSYETNTTVNY